jgi:hypothetical protein
MEYAPPLGVSYEPLATTCPLGETIAATRALLLAAVDETSTSIREGPLTGTGLAASQPPFATVPDIELVPASPAPAKIKHAAAVATANMRARRYALPMWPPFAIY